MIREKYEIVGIPDVVFSLQFVFCVLVKFVHVHVHEELRREIAEWQTSTLCAGIEAADDLSYEPDNVGIGNVSRDNTHQDFLVDRGKEFSDITFQNPNCPRVILACAIRKGAKAIHCLVRSFSDSTRV